MLQWMKRKKDITEKDTVSTKENKNVPPEVSELLQKVEQGDPEAQYQAGLLYLEGSGLKKDEKLAANLFQKAADQGHIEALKKLSWCYLYGRGVKQSLSYSLELSQIAEGTKVKVDMNKFGHLIRK